MSPARGDRIRSQVYNLQPLTSSPVIYDGGNVLPLRVLSPLRGLATRVCDRSRGYALRYAPCFTPGYLLPRLRRALKRARNIQRVCLFIHSHYRRKIDFLCEATLDHNSKVSPFSCQRDCPLRKTELSETNKYSLCKNLQAQKMNKKATDSVVCPSDSRSFNYSFAVGSLDWLLMQSPVSLRN